jgi:hypothetical protein
VCQASGCCIIPRYLLQNPIHRNWKVYKLRMISSREGKDPATRVDRESGYSPFCDHSRSFLPARIMRHRAETEIKVSVRSMKDEVATYLGYSPCMLCSQMINVRGISTCPCSTHTYGNPPKAWRLDIMILYTRRPGNAWIWSRIELQPSFS